MRVPTTSSASTSARRPSRRWSSIQATDQIIWSDYQRHETKQPEKTLEFLGRLEADLWHRARQLPHVHDRLGRRRARAAHRRQVRAGSRRPCRSRSRSSIPKCNSVIELGGQDAKIIVFKPRIRRPGARRRFRR